MSPTRWPPGLPRPELPELREATAAKWRAKCYTATGGMCSVRGIANSHKISYKMAIYWWYISNNNDWRKFRSQTSDNMDRWKRRGGKSQRRERNKKEDQRRDRVRKKKMQVCEKVETLWNTVFCPMFCGSGGSKIRLAKAAGAEPSGETRNEQLHAVVARSRFGSLSAVRSQNGKDTSWASWNWEMDKRRLGRWMKRHQNNTKLVPFKILLVIIPVRIYIYIYITLYIYIYYIISIDILHYIYTYITLYL